MSKKIIVIDDSGTVRMELRLLLLEAGYRVVEARDGLEGLDVIRRHKDAALVLCDINMPGMDGIEMLEAVTQAPGQGGPPFVMLTTECQAETIARAKKAGAKAWIVKPYKPELLLATVNKLARQV